MKAKLTDYQQMSTPELEDLLTDYQNEKIACEARMGRLTGEIEELQAIVDERNSETDDDE